MKEDERAELAHDINAAVASEDPAAERRRLEAEHGEVWDTDGLMADFVVKGFIAPFVAVDRKRDGVAGTLLFQHRPRFYFHFQEVTQH